MDALENVRLGMSAEKTVTVTSEMTVGHFVTPMMILHMEMASGAAIALRAL
jgi:fluoroacetyl-CoA thioesterase